MVNDNFRKIQAVFFIALLVGADAHSAQQDSLFSSQGYESFQNSLFSSQDSLFSSQTQLVAKQMELLQANPSFRELAEPFAEQVENVMANPNFEKLTGFMAEQMKTMMANPDFVQQAKRFAQQAEATDANPNAQEMAQGMTEQMESFMANPSFQQQAKQLVEELQAEPSFQSLSKRVAERFQSKPQEEVGNIAEQMKNVAKQMEAFPNLQEKAQRVAEMLADRSVEEQAKILNDQVVAMKAMLNSTQYTECIAGQMETLKANPNFLEHAKHFEMLEAEQMEAVLAANLESQEQTEEEQADSNADSFVDSLVDKLSGRVGMLSSPKTGLDESTVGKGSTLAEKLLAPRKKVPAAMVQAATEAGASKAKLQVSEMLIRGILSGAILGIATSLAMGVMVQPLGKELPALGALVFPVGFVMLVLLGFELVTGNMALLPMAAYAGKVSAPDALKSFGVVTGANFLGSILYAVMFWAVSSSFGLNLNDPVGKKGAAMAMMKTTVYATNGVRGWFQCVIKAILCNWMVTMGSVLSFATDSTAGRIAAMWLPILTFFAQQFEHLVVNFFVIPLGMLFGADISIRQWILWNMIPVFIGNLIGGSCLTGLPLAHTYPVPKEKKPEKKPETINP